jgi:CBS-domain-containing membrane protein
MRIEQIMTKDVSTCAPEENLNRAAQIMWERDCGVVPVVSAGPEPRVVGIVTDRDVCMASYTRGQRLDQIRIGDVMSTQVHACRPHDSADRAEELMKQAQVHRLPVVDDANQLLGLVSVADLARRARTPGAGKARTAPTPAEIGDTVAAISQERPRALVATAS